MLVEKLPWCTHEGGVFTVHVQAGGARCATGGADSQVGVWGLSWGWGVQPHLGVGF